MNKIILMGRLTADPEVRYTQSGKVVAQFTLAVDRPFTNQDGQKEADFIPVIIWGKSAEVAGNGLTKGQRALVEGRLQIRSYEAKDGSKRYVSEVIAQGFEFIERKETVTNSYQLEKEADTMSSFRGVQNKGRNESQGFDSFGTPVPIPFDEEVPF